MSKLNPKTLTVAAILLMVLALLFMATPLLPTGQTGAGQQFTPPGFSGQGGGFQGQAPSDGQTGQGVIIPGQGSTTQGGTNPNFPNRQFAGRGGGLLGFGLLSGTTGTIVYAVALLISLAAAVGMLMTKQWGKTLGIIMGVIYTVIALFSLVPTLLISLLTSRMGFRMGNSLSIGLNITHLVLAIAVIALASIRAKPSVAPVTTSASPPATPA
jgi:hypothetical protein